MPIYILKGAYVRLIFETFCNPSTASSAVAVLLLLIVILFIGFKYNKLKDFKEEQSEQGEVSTLGYFYYQMPILTFISDTKLKNKTFRISS